MNELIQHLVSFAYNVGDLALIIFLAIWASFTLVLWIDEGKFQPLVALGGVLGMTLFMGLLYVMTVLTFCLG